LTPADRAVKRVREYTDLGMDWGLAIFKAAEDTGLSKQQVTAELYRRRKAAKAARDAYKKPVKHWQEVD